MADLLYTQPQAKARAIIPKTVVLIGLSLIFYLGLLLNLSLLKLSINTEKTAKIATIILLIVIIALNIIFNFKRKDYLFYSDRIVFQNQQILLKEIREIQLKENFLDKLFKTYSLTLNGQFKISNIPKTIELKEYINKLIRYSLANSEK